MALVTILYLGEEAGGKEVVTCSSWVELLLQQSAELKTLLTAHKDVLLQCPQAHKVVGAPHGDW